MQEKRTASPGHRTTRRPERRPTVIALAFLLLVASLAVLVVRDRLALVPADRGAAPTGWLVGVVSGLVVVAASAAAIGS